MDKNIFVAYRRSSNQKTILVFEDAIEGQLKTPKILVKLIEKKGDKKGDTQQLCQHFLDVAEAQFLIPSLIGELTPTTKLLESPPSYKGSVKDGVTECRVLKMAVVGNPVTGVSLKFERLPGVQTEAGTFKPSGKGEPFEPARNFMLAVKEAKQLGIALMSRLIAHDVHKCVSEELFEIHTMLTCLCKKLDVEIPKENTPKLDTPKPDTQKADTKTPSNGASTGSENKETPRAADKNALKAVTFAFSLRDLAGKVETKGKTPAEVLAELPESRTALENHAKYLLTKTEGKYGEQNKAMAAAIHLALEQKQGSVEKMSPQNSEIIRNLRAEIVEIMHARGERADNLSTIYKDLFTNKQFDELTNDEAETLIEALKSEKAALNHS